MDYIELKNLITAFSRSFEEACTELNENNAKVNLEEAEFTLDLSTEFNNDLIACNDKSLIKGVRFTKIGDGINSTNKIDTDTPINNKSNLQIKLTLSNNFEK